MKRSCTVCLDKLVRLVVVASLVVVAFAMAGGAAQASPESAPKKPLAKNIIIMISDGTGYNHNLAADYYQYGMAGEQVYEQFPVRFGVSTFLAGGSYDPAKAWSDWEYVKSGYTDSAAAATAMGCGVKTYDGGIGVDENKNPVENIVEKAEKKGKATGVITTVPLSHATPAGFVAHNVSRSHYAEIAQEMVFDSGLEVLMGDGNPWYDDDGQPVATANDYDYVGGQSTWDALVAGTAKGDSDGDGDQEAWTLIQDRAEFQALASGPTPERLAGVPKVRETNQQLRSGDAMAVPFAVPFIQTVPTLAEMSKAAINVLDNDPDGFFLMIEGGAIDWAAHDGQPGRTIEERIDFNRAVEAVVEWVETNSNWGETLLIVTGDHETGYLWGPGSDPTWVELVNNGAGVQPGMQFYYDDHTNSLVPLWAKGAAARFFRGYATNTDPVRGLYIDNINIYAVMSQVLAPVRASK